MSPATTPSPAQERVISLAPGLPAIPERLLLAHARGEVLFICGAGVSKPAGLPDFRQLVVDIYQVLDPALHRFLELVKREPYNPLKVHKIMLTAPQRAEVKRFMAGDYDVVLGMLERRLDQETKGDSQVRKIAAKILRDRSKSHASIHRSLTQLADRGGVSTIVTTNFDLLLERAGKRRAKIETYSLGAMPRPSRRPEFSGVLHIHGALDPKPERTSELVLTDQDFGEYYLRRRIIPDFIYDAARLYNLVLIGYSANDPPMRYLLNAVAADGSRFSDLKERFTFLGTASHDPVGLEDWKARGITPVRYDSRDDHRLLADTLLAWASLSTINGQKSHVERLLKRIVRKYRRTDSPEEDRDLFDHLVRRSSPSERQQIAKLATEAGADIGWLDAIMTISAERTREHSS